MDTVQSSEVTNIINNVSETCICDLLAPSEWKWDIYTLIRVLPCETEMDCMESGEMSHAISSISKTCICDPSAASE